VSFCVDLPETPDEWEPTLLPSDEQVVDWLDTLSREDRLRVIRHLRRDADVAWTCWVQDHPGQIRQAWSTVRDLQQRVLA
jgi:hypothetical protein